MGYVYARWGSKTLHWHDWSDNPWASVYQRRVWCCSKNWLTNCSLWTFCSASFFVGSWNKPLFIFSFEASLSYSFSCPKHIQCIKSKLIKSQMTEKTSTCTSLTNTGQTRVLSLVFIVIVKQFEIKHYLYAIRSAY